MKKKRKHVDVSTYHPVVVIANSIRDVHRIGVKSSKLVTRFKAYVLPNSETILLVEQIYELAKKAEEQLSAIPSTWKPSRGSASRPIGKGDLVRLTNEAAKRFHGIVAPGQIFEVERIVGSRLVCVTQGGNKIMLPLSRSSVQRIKDGGEPWQA